MGLKEFKKTINIEEALNILFKNIQIKDLEVEEVYLKDGLNRVLSDDIIAPMNIPSFNKSAVDGYAVIAEDTFGASQTNPCVLTIVGSVSMGKVPDLQIKRLEAVEVTTGSIIPNGANAVVMIEYTKKIDEKKIEVYSSVAPNENISRIGEDIKKGDIVLKKGTRLKPPHLGVLASLGFTKVSVFRKPKVAVLSTGDELIEIGTPIEMGKTIDVNRLIISLMVEELGGEVIDLGIAPDNIDVIKSKLKKGLMNADIVVISGGTSVSKIDLVPEAINQIGKPGVIVHGISIRPAMPTGIAIVNGKPIFMLSGYPVAAIIGFNLFVKPLILRLLFTQDEPKPIVKCRVLRRIPHSTGLRTFVRVFVKKVGEEYVVEPLRITGSGLLTSMTKANGILIIPENVEGYEVGDLVDVTLIGPVMEA